MPFPPPLPPLTTDLAAQTATGTGGVSEDLGWVWGLVLGIFLLLLLCGVLPLVVYRVSGGEPSIWARVHYTHGNKGMRFRYATDEERATAAADLAIYQKAMSDAMATYSNAAVGYWNMRRDHRNFIKAGGLEAARAEPVEYKPPYAEKEEPAKPEAPDRLLPDQPSIDAELDKEFAESPEDRARRLEWIKYFVREGDLQRAFDLGWDGKPFRQAAIVKSPPEEKVGMLVGAATAAAKQEKLPAPDRRELETTTVTTPREGGGAGPSEAGPSSMHRI